MRYCVEVVMFRSPASCLIRCQRRVVFPRKCLQQRRPISTTCSLRKEDIHNLDEEMKKLNEKLKKELEGIKDTDLDVDKNFMNFKQMNERRVHERSYIFNWRIAAGTLAVGGSLLLALLYIRKIRLDEAERNRKITAGKARIGGEWELLNMKGELEGSKDLLGNWLLLYFGFTHCPDICPDEIEKMIKVVEKLSADKDPIVVKPIFISVDPARDTIKRVKDYCAEFSHLLQGYTGSKEQVAKVAKTFRVYHSEGPKTADDDYIVDHTVIMYLIDPEGNFCDYYGQNRTADQIADVLRVKVIKKSAKKSSFFA